MRISRRALLLGATGLTLRGELPRRPGQSPPRIFDPERALPSLAQFRRKAIRLHPEPAGAPLPPNASKIGGQFLWPADELWPFCKESDPIRMTRATGVEELKKPHNEPYQPWLQLRRDDFPELPWPVGKDIFQVLWCPRLHLWGNAGPRVYLKSTQTPGNRFVWREEASVRGDPAPAPPAPKNGRALAEYAFTPEDIVEYPQSDELGAEYLSVMPRLQGWFDSVRPRQANDPPAYYRYNEEIATAPGTKLLGYAAWIQDADIPFCSCGRVMKLLATLSGEEREDIDAWRHRRNSAHRQSRDVFGWPDSNAYIFYCATTHPIRIRTQVQSS